MSSPPPSFAGSGGRAARFTKAALWRSSSSGVSARPSSASSSASVRKGLPTYSGALFDMVANPRSATVMGLLEEARIARARGHKAAAQAGSVKTLFGRAKDWFLGNF